MIRIYDKEELEFLSLGLGSLDEAMAAVVAEELNGSYELELEYPIIGKHYDKLQLRNIIFCKPNMYSDEEPFRIYSITKPINGRVTVNAAHISYDASGVVIKPKRNTETNEIISFGEFSESDEGYLLSSVLSDINDSSPLTNRFKLIKGDDKENVIKENGYKIPNPMSLRSILGGHEGSLLDEYKGEYEFNRFNIYLKNKRGIDRGITIRYGKNLTDLEHESEGSKLYTGIFPFYSKKYTESVTNTNSIFQPAYVLPDVTPLRADWLTVEFFNAESFVGDTLPKALNPVVETVNVIVDEVGTLATRYVAIVVKTEGSEFEDKVYIFRKNTVESGNLIDAYINTLDESGNITGLKYKSGVPITAVFGNIYIIKDEGTDYYNKKIIYDKSEYVIYDRDGFYVEVIDARTVEDIHPFTQYQIPLSTVILLPTNRISWNENTSLWEEDPYGEIYVYPIKPNVSTVSSEKYVYLDLLDGNDLEIEVGSDIVFDPTSGILYINQELKDREVQNILTLDMTSDLDKIENTEPGTMTQEMLFNKAEQYLKDNDYTEIKETITVSFIQMSNSPEYKQFKDLEVVQLGDEITVIYENLGVNTKRRVIYTEYDVLTNSYSEIELGDKAGTITNNVISTGDNISSLKNDADFANRQYIVELIAENANIINAEIQNAIIKTLEVAKINVSGLLEASSGSIDQLVAGMLSADNAAIANALVAGTVRVKGDLTMDSGSITINKIQNDDYISTYIVENAINMSKDWLTDSNIPVPGWVYITYSTSQILGDVNVDASQDVDGLDQAIEFINTNYHASSYGYGDTLVLKDINNVYIAFECQPVQQASIDPTTYPEGTLFKVFTDGYYKDKIYKWNFTLGMYKLVSTYVFNVDSQGNVVANSLIITGGEIEIGDNFYVSNEGILTAKGIKIIDGEISIKNKFLVDAAGNVSAQNMTVNDILAEKIESDEVKTKEAIVDRLYLLADKNIYIERVTEDDTQAISHTVNVSASAMLFQDNNILYIGAQAIADVALYYDKNFIITVTYKDMNNYVYTTDIPVTITAGQTSGSSGDIISVSGMQQYTIDNKVAVFPIRYSESMITGTVTNKVVLVMNGISYDIITGVVAGETLTFTAQETPPDITNLRDQSLWFDID